MTRPFVNKPTVLFTVLLNPEFLENACYLEIATINVACLYFCRVECALSGKAISAARHGVTIEYKVAARVALFAPPAMLARIFQKLANTNVLTALEYEDQVRGFDAQFRTFFYPRLFTGEPFNSTVLEQLPQFGRDAADTIRLDMSKAYQQS